MTPEIVSAANPRMRRLARLADRRHRDNERVFVVEGTRLVSRALDAGLRPLEAYGDGTASIQGLDETLVAPEVLDRVSYRHRSQGLIAVFPQFDSTIDDLQLSDPALVLVTEELEKPGNLGAILRTADAAGADAVITTPDAIDRFNPNLIRASTGACFTVPSVGVALDDLISWLAARAVRLIAADPATGTLLWDADLTGPVALMVGAEDHGLSSAARGGSEELVKLPMSGVVDSLNASVTMALLAYEAVRQRMGRSLDPR